MEAPSSTRRGRGRPPLSPEARAAARERQLRAKAERQRKRREDIRAERERIRSMLTPVAVQEVSRKEAASEAKEIHRFGILPVFEPTPVDRARVTTLAGLGMRQDEIALLVLNPATGLPIGLETLREGFEHELAAGPAKANSKVGESLFKKATGDGKAAVTAAIFWLKARAGWRETQFVEVDLRAGVLVAPANLSPEQWISAARGVDAEKLEPGAKESA